MIILMRHLLKVLKDISEKLKTPEKPTFLQATWWRYTAICLQMHEEAGSGTRNFVCFQSTLF